MRAGFGVAYRALPPVTISLQSLGSRLEDIQMAKTTSAGAPFPLLFGQVTMVKGFWLRNLDLDNFSGQGKLPLKGRGFRWGILKIYHSQGEYAICALSPRFETALPIAINPQNTLYTPYAYSNLNLSHQILFKSPVQDGILRGYSKGFFPVRGLRQVDRPKEPFRSLFLLAGASGPKAFPGPIPSYAHPA
ncbi:MAG: hypothetical protein C4301_08515 [Thermus sp.]